MKLHGLVATVFLAVLALPSVSSKGLGDGSDSANACPGACTGTVENGDRACTFTAKVDIFASATGYYVFEECGSVVQPVLEMEAGVTYTFVQAHDSNWMHPMGFAYLPDGAHEGVDELEAGISQTGSNCVDDNTCDAPMYYQGDEFLGDFDPETMERENIIYPAAGNSGNFGLDTYEPRFQMSRGDWIGQSEKFHVTLTITDDAQTKDIFYFCHIHNRMSGRIKIIRNGEHASAADEPALYSPYVPSNFDEGCGTFGLGGYTDAAGVCSPLDNGAFFCSGEDESPQAASFNECLYAMDCAMHTEMRVNTHPSDLLTTFMYQMIPHHHNAVNMAKAILKKVSLNDNNDPEGELADLFWTIINEQNMQITFMEGWLAGEGRDTYENSICVEVDHSSSNHGNTSGGSTCDCDDEDDDDGYLVWACVMTALLVASWAFIIYEKCSKNSGSSRKMTTNSV